MDEHSKRLLTASKFKNWIACNYTIINEINISNIGEEGSMLMYSIDHTRFLNSGGETDLLGMNWTDSDREESINYEWIEYHIKKCDIIIPLVAIATPNIYVKDPLKIFQLDFE